MSLELSHCILNFVMISWMRQVSSKDTKEAEVLIETFRKLSDTASLSEIISSDCHSFNTSHSTHGLKGITRLLEVLFSVAPQPLRSAITVAAFVILLNFSVFLHWFHSKWFFHHSAHWFFPSIFLKFCGWYYRLITSFFKFFSAWVFS
jgi:hypothetical protein